MPTALITGVLGQDGSLLAELLLERGYRVVGIARPGSLSRVKGDALQRCELVELDLARLDFDAASSVIGDADEVYHLAACHHSSDRVDDPAQQQRMVEVNQGATLALAHAVLARGRGRLITAGSSQMFTPGLPAPRIDERTPHAPATFYGATKAGARTAIAWLREHRGLAASCAILFNHESERRTPAFASRKITRAAARIAAGQERELELADTSRRVDFSSAHDVVRALHAMALAEPADRVVASGELHSIAELCEAAFAAVGLDWREHVRSTQPAGERPALVGDPTRIEQLGWRRVRSFATWIADMVAADRAS